MPVIRTKIITPKKLDIEETIAALAAGVAQEGETQQEEYRKTTRTWRGKPDHELEFDNTPRELIARNITDDKIYYFLHNGTRVRYAVLSRDWQSKTTPRRLSSGPGRGRVVLISKKHPRPGIKAREWTDVIIRNRKRKYQKDMQRVMDAIAKKINAQGQA